MIRKNGQEGPGPLKIESCKALLAKLLELQEETGLSIISEEELHWIQTFWKSARNPDSGNGVANIVIQQRGTTMPEIRDDSYLKSIQTTVAKDKSISLETLHRLIAKVEEFSESHRALGLQEDLLQILQDDLRERTQETSNG